MKQFVQKPFIFKGNRVETGQQIEIDESRLDYFREDGLVGDKNPLSESAPAAVESKEETPQGESTKEEAPVKQTAKPHKTGKKKK